MAVNKNFVIKNGLEVNTNVLVAAAAESQVGVGTTRPYYKLHVGGGEGNRGGIGATDLTISGIATIGVAHSDSGAFRVLGISTFQGDIDLLGSAGVSTVRWDASEDRLEFKDNASVGFGTGNDLTIWHDSSTSYIKDTIGDLRIAGDKITLELEDGTDVKVIDQFGVNITGVTTTNRLYVSGIATVGTALSLADNIKAQFGTDGDLIIYANSSDSAIKDTSGRLSLVSNVVYLELEGGTNIVKADQYGIKVTGVTTTNRLYASGISTFATDTHFHGSSGITTLTWDKSANALKFNDHAKAIFGDSTDLQIYHRGDHSYISDTGTGKLYLTANEIGFKNAATDESLAYFTESADCGLYYAGNKKFSTTAIGATVFGDFITSGVGTFGKLYVTGISTFANTVNVSTGATITTAGNAAFAGIVTANGGLRVGNVGTIDANTGNVNISGVTTVGTALSLADNIKAQFGTDGDLIIYGNSSSTYIKDTSGDLSIMAETITLELESATNILKGNQFGINVVGVTTTGRFYSSGVGTFASDLNVLGNLNVTGDITYDEVTGRNLNITGITTLVGQANFGTSGVGATIAANGNATFSGIVTAKEYVGVFTSAGGAGIGIGSTTAHVGYGVTYIDFKGPGVSTVYASSVTGITTIYFQGGGGGSGVGAAGTWQNDGAQGISTAKSVGINTVGVAVTALQGGEKGASSGIGQTFQGLYISNGMVVNDNTLNGNHYIGTAFGGVMAGPVTVNGVITVDGNWAVV
jgi:hypothetical protein